VLLELRRHAVARRVLHLVDPANLITLVRYAMSYPVLAAIAGRASCSLPAADGHHGYF
jgi:hypothetical protein